MNIKRFPKPYQSMFRPACFTIENMQAPGGIDVEIRAVGRQEPLGVKRIYPAATATVNVAPYARRLLLPTPLCGQEAGIYPATGCSVACFISAPGLSSRSVVLCGGTEDAQWNTLLSAAPRSVKIAPGERDEMGIISEDWVSPVITFRRGGTSYTDLSMGECSAEGILAAVIDVDAVCRAYASMTGAPASELTDFSVRMKLSQSGFNGIVVERRYVIDRSGRSGRRLAWINRFGAVDYHTFPVAGEFRSGGSHVRIENSGGYRTVATSAGQSVELLSEPCDAATAEWLSEIFSAPAVWTVDGETYEKVDVAPGEVVCSPLRPTIVSVIVSPATPIVSRKL